MRWYHQASDDHTHRGRRNDRSLHGEEMVRHVGQACGRRRCAQEGQARWCATVHERREEEVETGDGSLFDGKLEVNESGGEMNGAEAIVLLHYRLKMLCLTVQTPHLGWRRIFLRKAGAGLPSSATLGRNNDPFRPIALQIPALAGSCVFLRLVRTCVYRPLRGRTCSS